MVRTSFAILLLTVSACVTSRLGPGVLRQDWNQRPRDNDPMANPAAQYDDHRWTPATDERIPGPGEAQPPPATAETDEDEDSPGGDLAKRSLATAFAAGFGWLPMVEAFGTFEEDPAARHRLRERRERAERKKAARRVERVERAPAD